MDLTPKDTILFQRVQFLTVQVNLVKKGFLENLSMNPNAVGMTDIVAQGFNAGSKLTFLVSLNAVGMAQSSSFFEEVPFS